MKIAIVCGSPSTMMDAPFDDPEWEIWVLGNRIDAFKGKRVTRIFEIHDDLSEHGDPERYALSLVEHGLPMIVGEGFILEEDNQIKAFPFKAAEDLWGAEYLTSSSAYMMALAILEGATEISIYGVDMAIDNFEYYWQRPAMEAWVGFAKGRGIKVFIPDASPLGKSDYVEGRQGGGKPDFKMAPFTQEDFKEISQAHVRKMADIQTKIRELENDYHAHSGAKDAYERLTQVARAIEGGQSIKKMSDTYRIK